MRKLPAHPLLRTARRRLAALGVAGLVALAPAGLLSAQDTTTAGFGPLRLGMTRAEVTKAAPCRLGPAKVRPTVDATECSDFPLGTQKGRLTLSFKGDRLAHIGLSVRKNDAHAREAIAGVLAALGKGVGELRSAELANVPVTTETIIAKLKRDLDEESWRNMSVTITAPDAWPDALVHGSFRINGSYMSTETMWSGAYPGSVQGSGSKYDIITYETLITITACPCS